MLIRIRHILLFFFVYFLGFVAIHAQVLEKSSTTKNPDKKESDIQGFTKAKLADKNARQTIKEIDTVAVDTIAVVKPKEALEDIVTHTADNDIISDVKNRVTTLYNNAKLHYQDVDLEAGIIIIDYKKNLIIAKGIIDSTGYTQRPYFKQGAEESMQDSLLVNYDSERALIWGANSEQTNGVLVGSKVTKKINDSTVYVRDIVITTSKKKKPDYDIRIKKAKIIPNKKIVAGASQLYIADVPTPAILPFAYFPLTRERKSGILMPTWGETSRQGYFIQNGGYYIALSDYFDLSLTGDIYTNGSWGFRAQSNYALRYKFSGNFSYNYDNNVFSLRGFDDYSKTTNYNIRWTHSQAAQANPNSRLSASVNLGSSKYFRESLNEYHTSAFMNNQLSSSVSYSRRFVGTPFNMSVSATHSQNTNTEMIDMSLPSLQLSMDRIYPFAPKDGPKKNAFQKMGLTYNLAGDYRISTSDENFFKKEMFDKARSGVKQSASLSTNMKLFNYFTINPSANYKETWYFDYLDKKYNPTEQIIETDTINGFKSFREYGAGVSLSTNVYGTFNVNKGRLKAIRHTIRPSVSYSYRPDFGFFDNEVYNPETQELEIYSPFQNGIYGRPGKGVSNSIGININNVLEAKVMSKDSLKTEARKIKLLNNLNLSTRYNVAADTMRWSPIGLNAGTQFFKEKMRVNFNATLDPYAINANGNRIDKFNVNNGGSLLRLTRAGITMNYSLSNATFKKGEKDEDDRGRGAREDAGGRNMLGGNLEEESRQNNQGTERKKKKTKLYYANMPWKLSLSYSLQYTNTRRENDFSTNSLMLNGDVELTPKWNVGFSSGYDFKRKGVTYTQLRFQRDLDSWKMSFNWVPFGTRTTYYFFIGVKSSVLSELKYDKRKLPDRRLF